MILNVINIHTGEETSLLTVNPNDLPGFTLLTHHYRPVWVWNTTSTTIIRTLKATQPPLIFDLWCVCLRPSSGWLLLLFHVALIKGWSQDTAGPSSLLHCNQGCLFVGKQQQFGHFYYVVKICFDEWFLLSNSGLVFDLLWSLHLRYEAAESLRFWWP